MFGPGESWRYSATRVGGSAIAICEHGTSCNSVQKSSVAPTFEYVTPHSQRSSTDHKTQFRDHCRRFVRLTKKANVRRQLLRPNQARYHNDFDGGGQRLRTAWVSFSPSMLPGMLMSVNSREMSARDSNRAIASSALPAASATKPASSTTSTESIRRSGSSSTIRTTGRAWLGIPSTASMTGNIRNPSVLGRHRIRLLRPYYRHPKAMRLQMWVESVPGQLHEVRCHPQALKITLSLVLRSHTTHLPKEGGQSSHTASALVGGPHHREELPVRRPARRRIGLDTSACVESSDWRMLDPGSPPSASPSTSNFLCWVLAR